jgi:hypothetical protein
MCVRSCDGYFFPISFSTTEDRFATDQAACQARCPGMDVSLYVHKVIGETSDQMRSTSGAPYTDLTNAFLYKLKGPSSDPETCGCRIPALHVDLITTSAVDEADEASIVTEGTSAELSALPTVPLPRWRPDPNAIAAIQTATTADIDAIGSPPQKKTIRIVGPAFFPE